MAPLADLAPCHYAAYSHAHLGTILHWTPLPHVASHIKILSELWPLGHSYQAEWILRLWIRWSKVLTKVIKILSELWPLGCSFNTRVDNHLCLGERITCVSNIVHILWCGLLQLNLYRAQGLMIWSTSIVLAALYEHEVRGLPSPRNRLTPAC